MLRDIKRTGHLGQKNQPLSDAAANQAELACEVAGASLSH
jgi:hypothetical protein